MKLPCAVVRDLLPLYAEKMTEPETQSLMEEHLRECPDCQKKFTEIESGFSPTVDTAAPLRTLKKEITRRRWQAALIAGLFVFVAIVTCFYHADSLKPIPWEEGLVSVKGIEAITPETRYGRQYRNIGGQKTLPPHEYTGEALILDLDSRIAGTETEVIEHDDGTVTAILQGFGGSSSFGQSLTHQGGEIMIYPVPDRLIYGYENPQKLLWGEPLNGGVEVLPRLTLSYYALIAAALAALSGLLWFAFRKKPWSRVLRQVFFAPVSYIMSHLLIMGFRSTSYSILRDFCFILLTACALYALLSLLWQVWLRRRGTVQTRYVDE